MTSSFKRGQQHTVAKINKNVLEFFFRSFVWKSLSSFTCDVSTPTVVFFSLEVFTNRRNIKRALSLSLFHYSNDSMTWREGEREVKERGEREGWTLGAFVCPSDDKTKSLTLPGGGGEMRIFFLMWIWTIALSSIDMHLNTSFNIFSKKIFKKECKISVK